MKLPQQLVESIGLCAGSADELLSALGADCSLDEAAEIVRLFDAGLPPVTSLGALAVMTGYNPGFLWSMIQRPDKYYRVFEVPKGRSSRQIEAPRVSLKIIQKWLSVHFERRWTPHDAVHGFVHGRSHISAARCHLSAKWLVSVDIANFFPTTTAAEVENSLIRLGYRHLPAVSILVQLCCFQGRLAQGAPSSPVISNIAMHDIDNAVASLAARQGAIYTRYADDIVLSGAGSISETIFTELENIFEGQCWSLSKEKRHLAQSPQRLKVHGLLVHGTELRLTKGYRNRLRAYRHLLADGKISSDDIRKISGHLNYSSQVQRHAR